MLNQNQRVMGVVGPKASGKDVVTNVLREQGYEIFSLSNVIRDILANLQPGPPPTDLMIKTGNYLRENHGGAILAQMTALKIHESDSLKFVVESIRNPDEISFLKKEFSAVIWGITAPYGVRLQRVSARARKEDQAAQQQMEMILRRDMGEGEPEYGQQAERCLELADILIENTGSIEELRQQVLQQLSDALLD